MCFLETGERQGDRRSGSTTSTRRCRRSRTAPGTSAKWLFNRMYWETVPQGRIPEHAPLPNPTEAEEGVPTMSDTDRQDAGPEGAVLPDADREDRAGDPRPGSRAS